MKKELQFQYIDLLINDKSEVINIALKEIPVSCTIFGVSSDEGCQSLAEYQRWSQNIEQEIAVLKVIFREAPLIDRVVILKSYVDSLLSSHHDPSIDIKSCIAKDKHFAGGLFEAMRNSNHDDQSLFLCPDVMNGKILLNTRGTRFAGNLKQIVSRVSSVPIDDVELSDDEVAGYLAQCVATIQLYCRGHQNFVLTISDETECQKDIKIGSIVSSYLDIIKYLDHIQIAHTKMNINYMMQNNLHNEHHEKVDVMLVMTQDDSKKLAMYLQIIIFYITCYMHKDGYDISLVSKKLNYIRVDVLEAFFNSFINQNSHQDKVEAVYRFLLKNQVIPSELLLDGKLVQREFKCNDIIYGLCQFTYSKFLLNNRMHDDELFGDFLNPKYEIAITNYYNRDNNKVSDDLNVVESGALLFKIEDFMSAIGQEHYELNIDDKLNKVSEIEIDQEDHLFVSHVIKDHALSKTNIDDIQDVLAYFTTHYELFKVHDELIFRFVEYVKFLADNSLLHCQYNKFFSADVFYELVNFHNDNSIIIELLFNQDKLNEAWLSRVDLLTEERVKRICEVYLESQDISSAGGNIMEMILREFDDNEIQDFFGPDAYSQEFYALLLSVMNHIGLGELRLEVKNTILLNAVSSEAGLSILETFVLQGIDVNAKYNNMSLVDRAVQYHDNLAMLDFLISRGATTLYLDELECDWWVQLRHSIERKEVYNFFKNKINEKPIITDPRLLNFITENVFYQCVNEDITKYKDLIKFCIEKSIVSVDAVCDHDENTLLMRYIAIQDNEMCEFLLSKNAQVLIGNKNGIYFIMQCFALGRYDYIELILSKYPDLDIKSVLVKLIEGRSLSRDENNSDYPAIFEETAKKLFVWCVKTNIIKYKDAIKLYIESNPKSVDSVFNNGKTTLLMWYFNVGDIEMFEFLLSKNAKIRHMDSVDHDVVMKSVFNKKYDYVKAIIKWHPNLCLKYKTTTYPVIAAALNDTKLLNIFLDMDSKFASLMDEDGYTPMYFAKSHGNLDMIQSIVLYAQKNATSAVYSKKDMTYVPILLHWPVLVVNDAYILFAMMQCTLGSRVTISDKHASRTIMHYAAIHNDVSKIHTLISVGDEEEEEVKGLCELEDEYGLIPLHYAMYHNNQAMVQILQEYYVPKARTYGLYLPSEVNVILKYNAQSLGAKIGTDTLSNMQIDKLNRVCHFLYKEIILSNQPILLPQYNEITTFLQDSKEYVRCFVRCDVKKLMAMVYKRLINDDVGLSNPQKKLRFDLD